MRKTTVFVLGFLVAAACVILIRSFLIPGYKPRLVALAEGFRSWPGVGVRAKPPVYDVAKKEGFQSCPGGTRTDGPCLMQF